MTVFLIALLACFIVVASFALGGFLGLYAGSKGMFPHKTIKEEKPKDEEKLTLEKQLENLMTYGGDA